MKNLLVLISLFSFTVLLHATPIWNVLDPPIAAYIDNLNTETGCDVVQAMGLPASGQNTSYNVAILSFWLSDGTASDASSFWVDLHSHIPENCGWGSDTQTMQKNLLNAFHNAGINLMISAFGSDDYPTSKDPTQVCTSLAQFVLNNNFDGVDIDYEDSDAFNSEGTGENWLITCTKVLRQYLPQGRYILTHAPQGPFFTTADLYPQGGYLKIDEQVGNQIDWYNLQYYNQGDDAYVTYGDLFVDSNDFPGSAVLQLKLRTSYGIALGKPVTKQDADNGWVDVNTLVSWMQEAHNSNGWCGGAMYWQLSSDANDTFGKTLRSGLQQIGQSCAF